MKTFGLACIAAILFVYAASRSVAQMGMRNAPAGFSGIWQAVAGSGAVYETRSEGSPERTMEIDIVGKESADGKDWVWNEITRNAPNMNNGSMVMKWLVAFDSVAMQMQPFKMILQMPGRPPMEMPDTMMHMRQPIQYTDVRRNGEDLGSESVTTAAGTFSCEHYRAKDG
jgi:hypothetical protein